jgi:hypothetical protein
MSMDANTSTETPAVKLAELAVELGVSIADVEHELGAANVFRVSGFRVTTGFRAAELIAEHARRKVEAEADAQRRAEEERARHEARRAHAQAERADTRPRVEHYQIQTLTVEPVDQVEGMLPVQVMTARDDGDFGDGAPMTKRPSRLDWMLGRGDGGSSIGPTPEQIKQAAEKRAAERTKGGTR